VFAARGICAKAAFDVLRRIKSESGAFDRFMRQETKTTKRNQRANRSRTFTRAALFLVLSGCQSTGYTLEATRCDGYCASLQRLHCASDDPADCVAGCEQGAHPWFGEPDPCDADIDAWIECMRQAPESDFSCLADHTTPRPDTCRREQEQIGACRQPVQALSAQVCLAWVAACSQDGGSPTTADGGLPPTLVCAPVVAESACVVEQLRLYRCMLAGPPQCDHAPPVSARCSAESAAVDACDPWFSEVCISWSILCSQPHPPDPRFVDACRPLRPPPGFRDACGDSWESYLVCLDGQIRGHCDPTVAAQACANERADLDACAGSSADAGAPRSPDASPGRAKAESEEGGERD
jgi:hypothetical protein